jgi:hypothetical protein
VAARDQADVRASDFTHALGKRVVHSEAHGDPANGVGRAYRREEKLIGAAGERHHMRPITRHVRGGDHLAQCGFGAGVHVHGRRQQVPAIVEQQNQVGADAPHVVVCGGEHGGGVTGRDGFAEAEIPRQYADAAG